MRCGGVTIFGFTPKRIIILVFALTAILAGYSFTHNSKPSVPQTPHVKASQVLTWDCEYPDYKPETIMLTCADGGWMVHKIKWITWTQDGARGTGYFRENLCQPSCAEGKIVEAKVNVALSDLTHYKGKFYLRTLDIRTPGEKDFPWGRAGVLGWDVMEFAEMMNDIEGKP